MIPRGLGTFIFVIVGPERVLELKFKRFGRKSLLGLHSVRWENLIF